MILSHTGVIATILWNEISNHHDFVVEIVGPGHALDLQFQQYQKFQQPTDNPTTPGAHRFQNIGNNTISSIVGSYKSAVTKYANRLGFPNGWQRLFHEHFI